MLLYWTLILRQFLGIDEIYSLVDDLIEAHRGWLPEWIYK